MPGAKKLSPLTLEHSSGEEAAPRSPKRVYPRKSSIVLNAAEEVFLSSGYAATSMDEIALRAGVSKRTVYSNFKNKDQLFAEVISKRCADIMTDTTIIDQALKASTEEGLLILARAFLAAILHPRQIELYQTVVAAVRRHPKVGHLMYDASIARTHQLFCDFLRAKVETGALDLDDVELAAHQLTALLKTGIHQKLLLGQPVKVNARVIEDSAKASVQLFLKGASSTAKA